MVSMTPIMLMMSDDDVFTLYTYLMFCLADVYLHTNSRCLSNEIEFSRTKAKGTAVHIHSIWRVSSICAFNLFFFILICFHMIEQIAIRWMAFNPCRSVCLLQIVKYYVLWHLSTWWNFNVCWTWMGSKRMEEVIAIYSHDRAIRESRN